MQPDLTETKELMDCQVMQVFLEIKVQLVLRGRQDNQDHLVSLVLLDLQDKLETEGLPVQQDHLVYQVRLVSLVTEVFQVRLVQVVYEATPVHQEIKGHKGQRDHWVDQVPQALQGQLEPLDFKETGEFQVTEEQLETEEFREVLDSLDLLDL